MTITAAPAISPAENMRGALLMSASMAGFVINDAFMRGLLAEMSLYQATLLRGLVVTVLLALLAARRGVLGFLPARPDAVRIAIRCAAEICAMVAFLSALSRMPFANLSAILQSLPLAITLAAALFMGASIGWRRLAAIVIGFSGVLIIIRPGPEGFNIYALAGLASVGFVTLRDLMARGLDRGVPSVYVAVVTAAAITLASAIGTVVTGWTPVDAIDVGRFTAAAAALTVGYVASVSAMRIGDIAVVAPFRYSSLLIALLIGALAFGEFPDRLTLLGAAIVVGTGLFTFYRERRRSLGRG